MSEIHQQFWTLDYTARKRWVNDRVKCCTLERHRPRSRHFQERRRRSETRKYTFVDNDGVSCQVCKAFIMSTLGYTSDMFITTLCRTTDRGPVTPPPEKLGRHAPTKKMDEHGQEEISRHIKSFNPCVQHYWRAHAPNHLYLPSELSYFHVEWLQSKTSSNPSQQWHVLENILEEEHWFH